MQEVSGLRPICSLIAFLALSPAPLPERPLSEIDESVWNALLKEFVNQRHQVDYIRLKRDGFKRLNDYIGSLGQPGTRFLSSTEKKAILVNA
jgi:hypothetical protein